MVAPDPEPLDRRGSPHFIYLAGCDGTGKSTQAQLLLAQLRESGTWASHLWLRFPFGVSLPLLAFARLRGFSHFEEDRARHGYWDFERSRLLSSLFPWVLLVDTFLASLWQIALPLWIGRTIVCERYVLDILVDLSLALKNPVFHLKSPGKYFLQLLPPGSAVLVLDLEAGTIRARRPDLVSDRRLQARLDAYRRLAADLKIPCISSLPPAETVLQSLWSAIKDASLLQAGTGYAHLHSPALRSLLGHPVLALTSHWTFQGLFLMGWGERAFKLVLDLLLTLLLGACLLSLLPWPLALLAGFLAAHTLNFLFNGHLWGALKHFGVIALAREEYSCYVDGLLERVKCEPAIIGVRVSGNLAKGAWTPASDFDARLVPAPGAFNHLRACCFLFGERSRALFARFPLDIYLEGTTSDLALSGDTDHLICP